MNWNNNHDGIVVIFLWVRI